jgi:hypothetical protein
MGFVPVADDGERGDQAVSERALQTLTVEA